MDYTVQPDNAQRHIDMIGGKQRKYMEEIEVTEAH